MICTYPFNKYFLSCYCAPDTVPDLRLSNKQDIISRRSMVEQKRQLLKK